MLHAVPAQSTPPSAPHPDHRDYREDAFKRAAEDALQLPGPDALAQIVRLYCADTRALSAKIDGLSAEASETAAERRRHFTMLTQVQMAASHKLWETAKVCAELATYREMAEQLRRLSNRADGEPILWEDVAAVLSVEPLEPAYVPVTLAFVPSDQFRGGQFVAATGDVTFVFTFIGWALIDHGPGAYGIVEPMFLVQDRAMPRSAIEHERHVQMEAFLPHLERAA